MVTAFEERDRYEGTDLPFYRKMVAPFLPDGVLDFHAHVWRPDQWREPPPAVEAEGTRRQGARYMVTDRDYPVDALLEDGRKQFPGRRYEAVVFGQPTPSADKQATNAYAAGAAVRPGLYPLRVTGRGQTPPGRLREEMIESPFFGYKVHIPWVGDDYADITPEDMIGPAEMEVANELGLVVLLHVPTDERLAHPRVQRSIVKYARQYPNASIVLAHCGRCYHPDGMKCALDSIGGLDNVYLDTAMVMDVTVLQMVLERLDASRVLFATDLPVAAMRGRRVYAMDHWVDVVLEGYPESAFRVASNNIRATFMTWEIVLAIARAGEMAGLPDASVRQIFHDNGMAVLRRVMGGKKLREVQSQRKQEAP